MTWVEVWVWVLGFLCGVGVAALLDNFLEKRINAFESEDDHERG